MNFRIFAISLMVSIAYSANAAESLNLEYLQKELAEKREEFFAYYAAAHNALQDDFQDTYTELIRLAGMPSKPVERKLLSIRTGLEQTNHKVIKPVAKTLSKEEIRLQEEALEFYAKQYPHSKETQPNIDFAIYCMQESRAIEQLLQEKISAYRSRATSIQEFKSINNELHNAAKYFLEAKASFNTNTPVTQEIFLAAKADEELIKSHYYEILDTKLKAINKAKDVSKELSSREMALRDRVSKKLATLEEEMYPFAFIIANAITAQAENAKPVARKLFSSPKGTSNSGKEEMSPANNADDEVPTPTLSDLLREIGTPTLTDTIRRELYPTETLSPKAELSEEGFITPVSNNNNSSNETPKTPILDLRWVNTTRRR